jgi:hypothetical protein
MVWQAIIFVCAVSTPQDQCETRAFSVIRPPATFVSERQCTTAMALHPRSHIVQLAFGKFAFIRCDPSGPSGRTEALN